MYRGALSILALAAAIYYKYDSELDSVSVQQESSESEEKNLKMSGAINEGYHELSLAGGTTLVGRTAIPGNID